MCDLKCDCASTDTIYGGYLPKKKTNLSIDAQNCGIYSYPSRDHFTPIAIDPNAVQCKCNQPSTMLAERYPPRRSSDVAGFSVFASRTSFFPFYLAGVNGHAVGIKRICADATKRQDDKTTTRRMGVVARRRRDGTHISPLLDRPCLCWTVVCVCVCSSSRLTGKQHGRDTRWVRLSISVLRTFFCRKPVPDPHMDEVASVQNPNWWRRCENRLRHTHPKIKARQIVVRCCGLRPAFDEATNRRNKGHANNCLYPYLSSFLPVGRRWHAGWRAALICVPSTGRSFRVGLRYLRGSSFTITHQHSTVNEE